MSVFRTPTKASGGHAPGSSSTAVASALSTSSGDLIVAVCVGSQGIGTTVSFSDTIGNSYVVIGSPSVSGNAGSAGSIFIGYCLSSKASNVANVVTATFGATQASFSWIYVWDVPISGGTAAFDVSNLTKSSASGNTPTSGSFSTTGEDELVLVAAGNDFTGITYTAGSGYTLDSSGFVSGVGGAERQLFTSPQSGITASMGQSSSTDWNIAVAGFMGSSSPRGKSKGDNTISTDETRISAATEIRTPIFTTMFR